MNISVQLLGPGYHTAALGTDITGASTRRATSPVADAGTGGPFPVPHVIRNPGFPFPGPTAHPHPQWGDTRGFAPAWQDPGAPARSPREVPAPAFAPLHTREPGAAHSLSLLFCRRVPFAKVAAWQLGCSPSPSPCPQLPFITLGFTRSAPAPRPPARRGLGGPRCLPAPARATTGSSAADPHVCGDAGSAEGARRQDLGGEKPMHRSLASLCLS